MFRMMNCDPDPRDGIRKQSGNFLIPMRLPGYPERPLKLRLNGHSTDRALLAVMDRLPSAELEEVSNGSFLIL